MKKRSTSQRTGTKGETEFRRFAHRHRLIPNKVEEDFGTDFLCQVEGPPNQAGVAEVLGPVVGAFVRATSSQQGRHRLKRDDAEHLLACEYPIAVVLIHYQDDQEAVYAQFVDDDLGERLGRFLLSEKKTMLISGTSLKPESEFDSQLDRACRPGFLQQVRSDLATSPVASIIPPATIQVLRSDDGDLALASAPIPSGPEQRVGTISEDGASLLALIDEARTKDYATLVRCVLLRRPNEGEWRPYLIRIDLTPPCEQPFVEPDDYAQALVLVERPSLDDLRQRLEDALAGAAFFCSEQSIDHHGFGGSWERRWHSTQRSVEGGWGERPCVTMSVDIAEPPPIPGDLLEGKRTGRIFKNFDRLMQTVSGFNSFEAWRDGRGGRAHLVFHKDEGRLSAVLRPRRLAVSIEPWSREGLRLSGVVSSGDSDRPIGPVDSPAAQFFDLGVDAEKARLTLKSGDAVADELWLDVLDEHTDTDWKEPTLPNGSPVPDGVAGHVVSLFIPVGPDAERPVAESHMLLQVTDAVRSEVSEHHFQEALGVLVSRGLLRQAPDPGPRIPQPTYPDLGISLSLPEPIPRPGDPKPGERWYSATPSGKKAAIVCAARKHPEWGFWRLGSNRLTDQVLAAVQPFSTISALEAACAVAHPAEVHAAVFKLKDAGKLHLDGTDVTLTASGLGARFAVLDELGSFDAKETAPPTEGGDPSDPKPADVPCERYPLPPYVAAQQDWYPPEPAVEVLRADEATQLKAVVRLLVIVTTEVERAAVLGKMTPCAGRKSLSKIHIRQETYIVGMLGNQAVAVVMTQMGTSSLPAASAYTVPAALAAWSPVAMIAVGIAFGRNPEKQAIGDVIVSSQVSGYELQRVGTGPPIQRGTKVNAGVTLLSRFSNVTGWRFECPGGRRAKRLIGEIISGEKLVDNLEFHRSLFAVHPNAIGGEMEATGVVNAAHRPLVEWLIVKAICDWGYGKSKSHQELAAAAAVSLVEHVLKEEGVLDGLTRQVKAAEEDSRTQPTEEPEPRKAKSSGVSGLLMLGSHDLIVEAQLIGRSTNGWTLRLGEFHLGSPISLARFVESFDAGSANAWVDFQPLGPARTVLDRPVLRGAGPDEIQLNVGETFVPSPSPDFAAMACGNNAATRGGVHSPEAVGVAFVPSDVPGLPPVRAQHQPSAKKTQSRAAPSTPRLVLPCPTWASLPEPRLVDARGRAVASCKWQLQAAWTPATALTKVALEEAAKSAVVTRDMQNLGRRGPWPRPVVLGDRTNHGGALRWTLDYSAETDTEGGQELFLVERAGCATFQRATGCGTSSVDLGSMAEDTLYFLAFAARLAGLLDADGQVEVRLGLLTPQTGAHARFKNGARPEGGDRGVLADRRAAGEVRFRPEDVAGNLARLVDVCKTLVDQVVNDFEPTVSPIDPRPSLLAIDIESLRRLASLIASAGRSG